MKNPDTKNQTLETLEHIDKAYIPAQVQMEMQR
jgi:hypothetical protein